MGFFNTAVSFFQNGGPFMYPIALVLVFGLAVATERWLYLTRAKMTNRSTFNRLLPLLKRKDFKGGPCPHGTHPTPRRH